MDPLLTETIVEPNLPIVDAHHHLWFLPEAGLLAIECQEDIASRCLAPVFRRHARYLFDEFMADIHSGHKITATVFVDAQAMYRADGPESMKSTGEVEFVNGVAAMSASGLFGEVRACAGIVGGVDLRLGDRVEEVLEAHLRAGGTRYRGIRSPVVHDEDREILGPGSTPHLLLDGSFRRGFKRLQPLGLSFDAFVLEPQIPELLDLARTFPQTQIILNHVGAPVGVGRYFGKRQARFPTWVKSIRALAECQNVVVKLGGLGIPFGGFDNYGSLPGQTSSQLAEQWKPYIEACIESFGVDRCMFESNFPVDAAACSYTVLWNTFKRITLRYSNAEKSALFHDTAMRVYRLSI